MEKVFVAPGNAGSALEVSVENVNIQATDVAALLGLQKANHVGLTIVGPEAPLVVGVVDAFRAAGLKIFGPTQKAAQLEGSKAFARISWRHRIPTASIRTSPKWSLQSPTSVNMAPRLW